MARDGRSFKKVTERITNTIIDIRTDGVKFWAHVNNMKIEDVSVKVVEDQAMAQARLADADVWVPILIVNDFNYSYSNQVAPEISFSRKFLVRECRLDGSFKITGWTDQGAPDKLASRSLIIDALKKVDVFPLPYRDNKNSRYHSSSLYVPYTDIAWTRLHGLKSALLWLKDSAIEELHKGSLEGYFELLEGHLEKALWAKPVTEEEAEGDDE